MEMQSVSGDKLAVTNLQGAAHLSLFMTFYLVQVFQLLLKSRRHPIRYRFLLLSCILYDVSFNSIIFMFKLTAAIVGGAV